MERLVVSAFGVAAVDLVAEAKYNQIVTWQKRWVVHVLAAKAIAP